MQYRLPWLIAAIAICAAALSIIMPFPNQTRSVQSRFPRADGVTIRAETIDFPGDYRLQLRYSLISDSGVEIKLLLDGKELWSDFARPLGVEHSYYVHSVRCGLDGDRITLQSVGTDGTFTEVREVDTGRLVTRKEDMNITSHESGIGSSGVMQTSKASELEQDSADNRASADEIQRRIDEFRARSKIPDGE